MLKGITTRTKLVQVVIVLQILFLVAFFYISRVQNTSSDSEKENELYQQITNKYQIELNLLKEGCKVKEEVEITENLVGDQELTSNQQDEGPWIVFAIHVTEKERYKAITQTWVKGMLEDRSRVRHDFRKAKVVFFSGKLRSDEEVHLDVEHSLEMNAWEKTRDIFTYMYDNYPEAKWYMKIDDDAHLFSKNLMSLLDNFDSSAPHYLGYPLKYNSKFTFASGGAGYLLSNGAMQAIRSKIGSCATIGIGEWQGPYEDVSMGNCLLQNSITITDAVGFHPHNPENMLIWDKHGHSPDHIRAEPGDGSSYLFPITYHYITPPPRQHAMYDIGLDYYAPIQSISKKTTTTTTKSSNSVSTCTTTEYTYKTQKKPIPKILHQIWLGDQSKRPVVQMDSCKNINPNWEYKLWNEQNIKDLPLAFVNGDHFSRAAHTKHLQSDILRYELLYQFGGMYIDADSFCLRPLDDLIDEKFNNNPNHTYNGFAAYESEKHRGDLVANGVMGSTQYSSSMLILIRDLHSTNWVLPAWQATGPLFLTEKIKKYKLPIGILPSATFFPYHFDDRDQPKDNEALRNELRKRNSYTHQLWGSTHNNYGHLRNIFTVAQSFALAPFEALSKKISAIFS